MSEKKHNLLLSRYCELISRHERMLRWQCLRHAYGDIDLSDDYFQEVALSLWRYFPSLSSLLSNELSPEQERAHIKRIARFALSHCSRKKRVDLQQLKIEMLCAFDHQGKEDEQLLDTFVNALPENYRTVISFYRLGYSDSEIADLLDLTPNAVRQRRYRAVAMMRSMYEKECNIINQTHHEH